MRTLVKLLALAGVCACAPSVAHAAVIEFQYTLHINGVGGSFDVLGQSIAVGDTLQGRVSWDTDAPDTFPFDPAASKFVFSNGPSFVSLDTLIPLSTQAFEVLIDDIPPGDEGADRLHLQGSFATAEGNSTLLMTFTSFAGDLFSSDGLPRTGIPASRLASVDTSVILFLPMGAFGATVTSFELVGSQQPPDPPNTVPEPTSLVLLGTGLLGAVRIGRRRLSLSDQF